MIGPLSYLHVEADNDDQARAKFAVMLDQRGGGLYRRWRDAGMRVAAENTVTFKYRNREVTLHAK
jgi:hypothetical protein